MHCISFESFLHSSTQRVWQMSGLSRECKHVSNQQFGAVPGTLLFEHSKARKFELKVTKTDAAYKVRAGSDKFY